ncbi:ABC transporter permease [Streptomyces sp. A3M-1-3]|uniref:ABC transporter permease n=1 Tax=Streptomyces sp. A3M-1-3 TaxID=2962044 RepID=UPI0020B7D974|nr:ABC transporter permease [Streptomyces sp. A3M-1-3]MCP3819411.1 ABC transporter permease [Streptomyces sp. A3M-1-3]
MRDAIAAEWIKIRSLRSTPAVLAIGLAVTVLTGLMFGLLIGPEFQRANPADRRDFDPVGLSFTGMQLGQLAVVVLAVLAVGSEFGSGMIRTSLAAVPRRGRLLTAKLVLLGSMGMAWGLVTGVASLLAGTWALGADWAELPPGDLVRTVAGAGTYATLLAVSAGSVTFLVRRSIAALGILLPLLFLVSSVLAASPQLRPLARLLPDRAGLRLMQVHQEAGDLTPLAGGTVLLLWTTSAVIAAYLGFARRDV